jgi:hypothetical protein
MGRQATSNRSIEPKSADDLGGARRAASRRQIKASDDGENSRSRRSEFQNHVEQWQFNNAGRKRVLQQELAQGTIVVGMRQRRVMLRLLRLRDRFRVMMVMFAASVLMLDRFRALRALLVSVSRRLLVRVDDGGRGRGQQRTRRQPSHQASSQPVEHVSFSESNSQATAARQFSVWHPTQRGEILLGDFRPIKLVPGFCRIFTLAIG